MSPSFIGIGQAGRWAAWVITVLAGAGGAQVGAHSGGVLRV
jgi:hypothetical protein